MNTFKNQIIEWYRLFGEEMSLETVLDKESYHDFKILYEKLVDEKNKKNSDEDRSFGKLKKLVRIKSISHISRRLYYTVRGVIEKY